MSTTFTDRLKTCPTGAAPAEAITGQWRDEWTLRPGVTYLNHGSFGLAPRRVREAQRAWQDQLEEDPVDFFTRVQEGALAEATAKLARFVGASERNIALVENATAAMNVVAQSFPLDRGDEVVLTNYEYGAVRRIWERACNRAGAQLVKVEIPFPPESATGPGFFFRGDECFGQPDDSHAAKKESRPLLHDRTKLIVVSHIFSEPAHRMAVEEVIAAARERGVAVCVDGPHAVAQLPLSLDELGCDFYTASCHKWLSGPLGSGFLYVAPKWHDRIEPPILSWGRLQPAKPESWREEFWWNGTRSLSAYLAIPAAIELLEEVGLETFRRHGHALAIYGAELVDAATGLSPPADRDQYYAAMTLAELPLARGASELRPDDSHAVRALLWERYRIEIPVLDIAGRRFVRISAHLYNTPADMQRLAAAVAELLRG
jgi:isopenicillin-N epimerase